MEAVTEREGNGNREKSNQIHRYEVSAFILEGLCFSGKAPHSMAEIEKIQNAQMCITVSALEELCLGFEKKKRDTLHVLCTQTICITCIS